MSIHQGIQDQIIAHRAEPVNFDDVKDEIFDMIKPKDATRITLKDLIDRYEENGNAENPMEN